ncbi:MAG: 50S ribosomal protein L11 methyltransferase [Planctomycetaceae bacterium]
MSPPGSFAPRRGFVELTIVAVVCALVGWRVVAWGESFAVSTGSVEPAIHSKVVARVRVVDFPEELVLYETVFWEPKDTTSLRDLIRAARIADGKDVLEIGTGSGLISLCCAKSGANRVVATDINSNAVANARDNARRLGVDDRIDVRQVSRHDPGAYAVLKDGETFDLIISNPPWENRRPTTIDSYALDDENFALMRSLLSGLKSRLKPGGRAFLAYGCVSAIRELQKLAPQYGLTVRRHDDRDLDDLDEVFLPGMLLIVTPTK